VDLEVSAEDGWKKTLELSPSTAFTGSSATADVAISVPVMQRLTTLIEEETDYRPGSYNLSIVPTISVRGDVDDTAVDSTYAPVYTFQMSAAQIEPISELNQNQTEPLGSTPIEQNQVSIAGIDIGVQPLRIFGGMAALIGIMITGAIAAAVFLGLGRGEVGKIQAKYQSILIEVNQVDPGQHDARIQVASIEDLARLAKRDGGIIFHQQVNTTSRRYFVPDGSTVYEYTPASAT
jgi:hypothetical protein